MLKPSDILKKPSNPKMFQQMTPFGSGSHSGFLLETDDQTRKEKNPIQDIFRIYMEDKEHQRALVFGPWHVAKSVTNILNCQTAESGVVGYLCDECGRKYFTYKSCGDRNCPNCHRKKQVAWEAKRLSQIVEDAPYFHVVFTVPDELNGLFKLNQEEMYSLLFNASAEAIKKLAADKRRLGGTIGFISVLHTWGSNLAYHPHIHMLVMGAGLSPKGNVIRSKDKFLVSGAPLAKLFRGIFLDSLKHLIKSHKIQFADQSRNNLVHESEYPNLIDRMYRKKWVVYLKDQGQPDIVVKYLSRYTYRTAIANSRIVKYDREHVVFWYNDYKEPDPDKRRKQMTLSIDEFVRRFIMHILPSGFSRTRYYGLLSSAAMKKLEKVRAYLKALAKKAGTHKESKYAGRPYQDIFNDLVSEYTYVPLACPFCNKELRFISMRTVELQKVLS